LVDDLMKCLYEFMKTRRLGALGDDPEYEELLHIVELQQKRVEEDMDKEQRQELKLLLENVSALNSVEQEHHFQAALGLARELGRLVC